MSGSKRTRARWGSIALGWAVATLVAVMVGPVFSALFGFRSGPPGELGDFTAAVFVFLVTGFLVYLVGGYVAARLAGPPGGLYGAMTAVLGAILGMILAVFGAPLAFGVALPPILFGPGADGGLAAGLLPFFVDLLGGYVGGKLGESSQREARRLG